MAAKTLATKTPANALAKAPATKMHAKTPAKVHTKAPAPKAHATKCCSKCCCLVFHIFTEKNYFNWDLPSNVH